MVETSPSSWLGFSEYTIDGRMKSEALAQPFQRSTSIQTKRALCHRNRSQIGRDHFANLSEWLSRRLRDHGKGGIFGEIQRKWRSYHNVIPDDDSETDAPGQIPSVLLKFEPRELYHREFVFSTKRAYRFIAQMLRSVPSAAAKTAADCGCDVAPVFLQSEVSQERKMFPIDMSE